MGHYQVAGIFWWCLETVIQCICYDVAMAEVETYTQFISEECSSLYLY